MAKHSVYRTLSFFIIISSFLIATISSRPAFGWFFGGGEKEIIIEAAPPPNYAVPDEANAEEEKVRLHDETVKDLNEKYDQDPSSKQEHVHVPKETSSQAAPQTETTVDVGSDQTTPYVANLYDAESFLGQELAEKSKGWDEQNAKNVLKNLMDRIDSNKDAHVELGEMTDWLTAVRNMDLERDADAKWARQPINDENSLEWPDYAEHEYGPKDDLTESELARRRADKHRWGPADADDNGMLNRDEFSRFVNPEIHAEMRDTLVEEALTELDENENDRLSREEFLAGLDDEAEQQQATTIFDRYDENTDDTLDSAEIANWLFRNDDVVAQAQHLIKEADRNKDEKLSKDEMMAAAPIFTLAGSKNNHGEL